MKRLAAFVLALASVTAWAQEETTQGLDVNQERARIAATRRQQTAELDAQERACQSRFAVVDCVNQVSARRRALEAELKRQEASLNAAQRRQRGAEQLQRSEDKAAENAQRLSDMQAAPAVNTEAEKREAQNEKIRQHAKPPAPAASAAPESKTAGPDAATAAKNRADYVRKQEDALQRKRDRDKRLQEQGTVQPPLPAPP